MWRFRKAKDDLLLVRTFHSLFQITRTRANDGRAQVCVLVGILSATMAGLGAFSVFLSFSGRIFQSNGALCVLPPLLAPVTLVDLAQTQLRNRPPLILLPLRSSPTPPLHFPPARLVPCPFFRLSCGRSRVGTQTEEGRRFVSCHQAGPLAGEADREQEKGGNARTGAARQRVERQRLFLHRLAGDGATGGEGGEERRRGEEVVRGGD